MEGSNGDPVESKLVMDPKQIEAEAARYLKAVLTAYRRPVRALACEIDPGAASFYVFAHTADGDIPESPENWSSTYIEQEVEVEKEPSWFARYDELQSQYYTTEEIEYEVIEQALGSILKGVSKALASLSKSGQLQELGVAQGSPLAVFTEDDDSVATGFERVASVEAI